MGLQLSDIGVNLGNKRILDGIELTLEDGGFLSLLGASGAGKSTVLKIIAGLLPQDRGTVTLAGEAIDDLPAHRRRIAVLFQDFRLFPHMDTEENVAFALRMRGVRKAERLAKARELLEMVQLPDFGKRKVTELSGGQKQRVALARALAAEPRVLLLDEPFSGLDESLRDDIRQLVGQLQSSLRMTTLMVTHDAHEALMMSDRIVYISEGRVVQDAEPSELYHHPRTLEVASCFGACSVIEGSVQGGSFEAESLRIPLQEELPAGEAQAVLRFAALSLGEGDSANASGTDAALRVEDCIYQGDVYRLTLTVDDQKLFAESHRKVSPGTTLWVRIDPRQVFVYPRQGEPT